MLLRDTLIFCCIGVLALSSTPVRGSTINPNTDPPPSTAATSMTTTEDPTNTTMPATTTTTITTSEALTTTTHPQQPGATTTTTAAGPTTTPAPAAPTTTVAAAGPTTTTAAAGPTTTTAAAGPTTTTAAAETTTTAAAGPTTTAAAGPTTTAATKQTTQASDTNATAPVAQTEKTFSADVIDSSNIQQFASQINERVPPSQLAKLDKTALASVSNVRAINTDSLSGGGKQMLCRLIRTNVADAVAADTVDAAYIKEAKCCLDAKTLAAVPIAKLKTAVTEALVGSSMFCDRDNVCCGVWGDRLCIEIKNDCALFTVVSESDLMSRMKPKCFKDAMDACGAPAVNTTGIRLPPEGKRELLRAAGINITGATDPVAEITKVAPELRSAISADDLAKGVPADKAADAYALIKAGGGDDSRAGRRVGKAMLTSYSPQQLVLARLAKSTSMTGATIDSIASADQFTTKEYSTKKTEICGALSFDDIENGIPPAYGDGFCNVYQNCKTISNWGEPTLTNAETRYGPLLACASDTTLNTIFTATDSAKFLPAMDTLDDLYFGISQGKKKTLGMICEKRLNATAGANDLKSKETIRNFKQFLPYVSDIGTRFDALTSVEKKNFCDEMKYVDLTQLDAAGAHVITAKCVKYGGPLRDQLEGVTGGGDGIMTHYSDFLTAADIGDGAEALLTCAQVNDAIDLFAEGMVLDCAARKKIYQCYRDSLTDIDNADALDLLGSFTEYFSEADWTSITDNNLCGLKTVAPRQFEQLQNKRLYRKLMGSFKHSRCEVDGWKRSVKKLATACKPTVSRRRRATATYTCDDVESLGLNVEALATADISGMSDADIEACIPFFGEVESFSAEHWTTLATKAIALWGDAGNWTSENIITANGIVSGLAPADIDSLIFDSLDAIAAAGRSGVWSKDKLTRSFSRVKAGKYDGRVATITDAEFNLMGDIACGATTDDIKSFSVAEFCNAAFPVGLLETCETSQLVEMAALIKKDACLGSDVSAWLPNQAASIGAIVGGLSKDDLAKLPLTAVAQIKPYVIAQIPTENINGFSKAQLGAMDSTQANSFTSTQLNSLDDDKKELVAAQASETTGDGSNGEGDGGNGDGDSGSGLPEASILLISTMLLTALFRM